MNIPVPGRVDDWRVALQPTTDDWKKAKQTLTFNNEGEPQSLDPALMTGVLESRVTMALFEGLAMRDPKTLTPRPAAAASWTSTPDGLTWTFTLRATGAWSDGTPVVAEDFVRSWHRVLTPTTASEYAYMLFPIKNAEAFNQGKVAWTDVGVIARDKLTLEVTLAQPTPWFLELCTFHTLYPVRLDVVIADPTGWTRNRMIGNGPFAMNSWQPRTAIVMTRNAHYWDRDRVRLETLIAKPLDDLDTTWRLYQTGAIDWTPAVPIARIDEIKRHPDYYCTPYMGTYYFRFNVTKPPLDDVNVRRALCMATDRASITKNITKAGEVPAGWFVPRMGSATGPALAFNVDAARAALAASGYAVPGKPGKPLPPIALLFNTSENHKAIAEALVQQWSSHLGVTVTLDNAEWKVYLERMSALDYAMARSSWIGDYLDPNTFLDLMVTNGGNNRTGWSNPTYDAVLKASQLEADPTKRAVLLTQLERMITVEHCPVLPLYTYVNKGLLSERVHGMHANLLDHHPWQFVWIEP